MRSLIRPKTANHAAYYTKERREMLAFVPEHANTILDIGCGAGAFAAAVKTRTGAEAWGLEADPEYAHAAEQILDKVLIGDVAELARSLPDARFDVIICNDVLEHLVDPGNVLRTLVSKLSPHGLIVFSLPNVRYFGNLKELLLRKDWRYQDEGILDRTHLRFFTAISMRRLFEENGYRILRMEGIHPLVSWKFEILNALTFGSLRDARYLQFAGVAAAHTV